MQPRLRPWYDSHRGVAEDMADETHDPKGPARDGPERIEPSPGAADPLQVEADQRLFEQLVQNLVAAFTGKTKLDLLLISGGGSRGAWGAGFLNGWSQSTNLPPARPVFDVVTGVSTGAVQAPAAFMGSAHDDKLRIGYTQTTNSDVYGFSLPLLPRNLDALEQTLASFYPNDFWQLVGQETPNRRLFVGTVNIETAQFCSWDLTRLAEQGDYDLCRRAITASAANPAGIWPVMIDGEQHVDGGVRYRLYVDLIFRSMVAASNLVGVSGVKNVYYLVNGPLGYEPVTINSWNFPAIVERALFIAIEEGLFGSLYGSWYHMNGNGVEWDFHGVSIPLGIPLPDPDEYDPAQMIPLYDLGRAAGIANNWAQGLPAPATDCVKPPLP